MTVSTEGTNKSVTGTATDKAGNSASATVSGINIDEKAPTITGAPDRAANAAGWYNNNVTVSFTANDALSGVASVTAPVTVSTEGANRSVTGTVTDKAGNSASATVNGINIDKTPPTVSFASLPTSVSGTQILTANASDAQSGVDNVQFLVDNKPLATIATTGPGPYSIPWDTTSV